MKLCYVNHVLYFVSSILFLFNELFHEILYYIAVGFTFLYGIIMGRLSRCPYHSTKAAKCGVDISENLNKNIL